MTMHVRERMLASAALVPNDIERKEGDPAAVSIEIKKSFEDFNKAFDVYRQKNDQRLADIEKKGSADVVTKDELKRLDTALDTFQKNMEAEIVKLKRPRISGETKEATQEEIEHKAAFSKYFRKGIDAGLRELESKALATSSDPDGGYIVPRETETTIDRVLGTVSAMRGLATVRQISGSGYKKPVNLGGTTSGWVGETESRLETSTPTISLLDFPAMELYANPYATQTMLDDAAINADQWLAEEVSVEFAEEEGAAFISGSGVNRPRGLLSYTNVLNSSYAWGGLGWTVTGHASAFASSNPGDALFDLQTTLKTGYQSNATWMMTRTTQAAIRKFKEATTNAYMWQPGLQAGQPATLLGRPVVTDDNMNELGANLYPIAYGDFRRGYLIVDRVGIRVLRDPYSAKPYVTFYTTKRVGGGIQNFEAIKLMKCST